MDLSIIETVKNWYERPYIYLAFSEKDKDFVAEIFSAVDEPSVWHRYGSVFGGNITEAENYLCSENCIGVIFFISKDSMSDYMIQNEMILARKKNLRITPVRIDDAPITPQIEEIILGRQMMDISKYAKNDKKEFGKRICSSVDSAKISLYIMDGGKVDFGINVEELILADKGIIDISPLKNCRKLKRLALYQNKIEDIRVLADLTTLTDLNLRDNKIKDISALKGLKLTSLTLGENQITDISPLKGLKKYLKKLRINSNYLDDRAIDVLAELTNLEVLYINDNEIRDPSRLTVLTKLQDLRITRRDVESAAIDALERKFTRGIIRWE